MEKELLNLSSLSFLKGCWYGTGLAQYPTIRAVEYREELNFLEMNTFNVLKYEQKTWVKSEEGLYNVPIFWETGFLIEREDYIELCNVQKNGRMEILTGKIIRLPDSELEISFKSKEIFNDAKMIKSGREFHLSPGEINYELWINN